MKIVLVHNVYRQAGGEDVVFRNEKALLERSGHTVIPFVRSNAELDDTSLLGRIGIVPQMIWSQQSRRSLAGVLDAERPDLVHVHNTFMAISPSIFTACSERSIPVVKTLHNYRLLCPAASFFRDETVCEECLEHSLLRSVFHGCYRKSRHASGAVALMLAAHRALGTWQKSVNRYIALTNYAKQKFVQAGFPADRFAVKPHFAYPDPGEKIAAGDYAVFIGRLDPTKGTKILLDAWNLLPTKYPLHVVGDGPDRQWMEDQVRTLRLPEVVFRGRLSHADALDALKGARFTIMPSTWYETFGLCIIESFACGTPVLCSRLGAMSELVDDGVTGLHFNLGDPRDLADKVEWAWDHPLELAGMGRAARRRYESEYTAEKNYAQLMQVYEQAMAANAPRSVALTGASQPV